jgi:diadenosine tetraphosphate (Ap4A) HIT family hydrolase
LFEDDKYFAIHDIKKASAKQHILVLTKKHIRSALDIKDKQIILELKDIAEKVLNNLSAQ